MNAPQKPAHTRAAGRRVPLAQWSIFGFRVAPLALFALGSWAAVYGLWRHRIPVTTSQEREYTEVVPTGPDLSSLVPGMLAPPPPPPKIVTRIETFTTTAAEAETTINRDVTVGRLARGEGGDIVRAAAAAAGPGYCPT